MSTPSVEAAVGLFSSDGELHSLLSYGEFDAILFRAASLPHFANELVHCVLVDVAAHRLIRSAIFFLIRVDGDGYVAPFNTPLDVLVGAVAAQTDQQSSASPVLVTRSNCPDPEFTQDLWLPEEQSVRQLYEAVRASRLFGDPSAPAVEQRPQERNAPGLDSVLEELQAARLEIGRLRSALHHEQDRNRRLQDALLGGAQRRR